MLFSSRGFGRKEPEEGSFEAVAQSYTEKFTGEHREI
jgi:hypothetical protein